MQVLFEVVIKVYSVSLHVCMYIMYVLCIGY